MFIDKKRKKLWAGAFLRGSTTTSRVWLRHGVECRRSTHLNSYSLPEALACIRYVPTLQIILCGSCRTLLVWQWESLVAVCWWDLLMSLLRLRYHRSFCPFSQSRISWWQKYGQSVQCCYLDSWCGLKDIWSHYHWHFYSCSLPIQPYAVAWQTCYRILSDDCSKANEMDRKKTETYMQTIRISITMVGKGTKILQLPLNKLLLLAMATIQ